MAGKQKHQKAIIAALLVTPSSLHRYWQKNEKGKVTDELGRLKLSDDAKKVAQTTMDKIDATAGLKKNFAEAAEFLRDQVWEGVEPHPNDEESLELSKKAKEMDKE